jgi:hypothetical protein
VPRSVFKYTTANVNPTAAFPARRVTLRPYLALNLLTGSRSFSCYALIDSGADDCIFPAMFVQRLGLEFHSGRRYSFGGVGSSGQEAYFLDVDVDIVGVAMHTLSVGFSTSLDGRGHGLLGQNGFFERFSVRFDHKKGTFTIFG